MEESLYNLTATRIDGTTQRLDTYRNKVLLIVNVASNCGFTPQYRGLEALYQQFRDRGFEVLAFPCNQFGAQEPGTALEISAFCEKSYHITFPLFSKVDVNGKAAHPLFDFLKRKAPGVLGTRRIKWNFTKFLIDRTGMTIKRFAPQTPPEHLVDLVAQLLES